MFKILFGFLIPIFVMASESTDSVSNATNNEPLLPKTIIVKDGQIVGSGNTEVSNQDQAKEILNSGLASQIATHDMKVDHLSDSSQDSYYYYYTNGYYYNYYTNSYGYYYSNYYYSYQPSYNWNSYSFYTYSSYYFPRPSYYYFRYYHW